MLHYETLLPIWIVLTSDGACVGGALHSEFVGHFFGFGPDGDVFGAEPDFQLFAFGGQQSGADG